MDSAKYVTQHKSISIGKKNIYIYTSEYFRSSIEK